VLRLVRLIWDSGRADLKIRILLAFAALLAAKAVNAVVPFFYRTAVDALAGDASAAVTLVAVPTAIIVAYGVARFGSVAFNELRDGLFAAVGQHAVRDLANRSFAHLHALSLRFHLERRTGGLSRIIERGNEAIETIVRVAIFNLLPTAVELILVTAIFAIYLSVWFAVILVVTVAVYTWFTFRLTEWRVKIRREMNEADSDAYTKAVDSLLNYETVKYFGNEGHEARRFDRAMRTYETAAVRTTVSLAYLNAGQSAIFTAGMVAAMVLAGFGVADGWMTVGDFVLVNAYLLQVYVPLNFLGMVHRLINQGMVDLERLFELLAVKAEVTDREGALPLVVEDGEVRFDHVDFSYDGIRPILRDLSFTVPAGRMLAIAGPSGAGKSTIARLLFRFYDVADGRVTIDGQDLREVTQDSLRAAIGMVPQDTVLFNDTIAYNIRYGRPDAADSEVEEAARLAQIHDFIMSLPGRYDTEVGERGLKLSGGEKQRVAIARTILKAPPILILDEATSALDSLTEKEIQSAFKTVTTGRTTLVIAHRLSTIANADEIIVLDQGRVAERGTHRELLDADGIYAAMWARQRDAAEAEERLRAVREAELALDQGMAARPRPTEPPDILEQIKS
jgi:ATP-binding cassette subfamily B protein